MCRLLSPQKRKGAALGARVGNRTRHGRKLGDHYDVAAYRSLEQSLDLLDPDLTIKDAAGHPAVGSGPVESPPQAAAIATSSSAPNAPLARVRCIGRRSRHRERRVVT